VKTIASLGLCWWLLGTSLWEAKKSLGAASAWLAPLLHIRSSIIPFDFLSLNNRSDADAKERLPIKSISGDGVVS
jgi:hypothetical protein